MASAQTTVGSGSHTYTWDQDWAKLPAGATLGYTHGVQVDSADRIYIHHRGTPNMLVFDQGGNCLSAWGEEYGDAAHGLFLNREGDEEFLYLALDKQHRMVKTTLDGQVVLELGVPPLDVYDEPGKYKPTETTVGPNGDIYVTDGYGQSYVHRYDAQGNYLQSWGGKGAEPGQLSCPHGIRLDTRGEQPVLLVADRANVRIQTYSLDGELLDSFNHDIRFPCGFQVWQDELYIPDLHSRVTVLGADNQLITHLGDTPEGWKKAGWPEIAPEEQRVGHFSSPHGLSVDSAGNIYVGEWISNGRIIKLTRQG